MATLGKVDISTPEDLETGVKRFNTFEDALLAMQERGLHLPSIPESGYKGEMPPDLSSLDDGALGDLLNDLSRWCSYVEGELSKTAVATEQAEDTLEFIKARIRISIRAQAMEPGMGKLTVSDKDDIMLTHPKVVEAQSQYLYHSAMHTMTKAILERAQRNWDTISRRITQRGQEVDRMRREGNIAGVSPTHPNRSPFRRTGG